MSKIILYLKLFFINVEIYMTVALAWGMYGVVTGECLVSSETRTVGTY